MTVNVAVNVQTSCKITPRAGCEIYLKSHDTVRDERFASLDDLLAATEYEHALAARLVRFFRPTGGFTLETHSESPAGAGISGSSAMMIATTAALARFAGQELELEQIRVIAQNVEAQLIKVPTGCQDYYPAMYGGVNAVHLDPDGIHCEPIPVSFDEIDQRLPSSIRERPDSPASTTGKSSRLTLMVTRKSLQTLKKYPALPSTCMPL